MENLLAEVQDESLPQLDAEFCGQEFSLHLLPRANGSGSRPERYPQPPFQGSGKTGRRLLDWREHPQSPLSLRAASSMWKCHRASPFIWNLYLRYQHVENVLGEILA